MKWNEKKFGFSCWSSSLFSPMKNSFHEKNPIIIIIDIDLVEFFFCEKKDDNNDDQQQRRRQRKKEKNFGMDSIPFYFSRSSSSWIVSGWNSHVSFIWKKGGYIAFPFFPLPFFDDDDERKLMSNDKPFIYMTLNTKSITWVYG